MTDDPKWHILLPPGVGGTTATPVGGLFDSEDAAWDYVATLPTEQGLRARVLRWNPGAHDDPPA